jgi:hypothetical protein
MGHYTLFRLTIAGYSVMTAFAVFNLCYFIIYQKRYAGQGWKLLCFYLCAISLFSSAMVEAY